MVYTIVVPARAERLGRKVVEAMSSTSLGKFDEVEEAHRKLYRVRKEQSHIPRQTSVVLLNRARVLLHTKVDEPKPWPDWD